MRNAFASDLTGYLAGTLPDRDSLREDNAQLASELRDVAYHTSIPTREQRRWNKFRTVFRQSLKTYALEPG